jgi:two-component system response regulator HydG
VERYYIEQALTLMQGNREEAAKLLGIGERTLYRVIQDWKLQDKIKDAMAQGGGDLGKAAEILGLTLPTLQRKMKKMAMLDEGSDE